MRTTPRFVRLVAITSVVMLSGCWTQFRGDATHTGNQAFETKIGAAEVGGLAVTWRGAVNAVPASAPAVAGGIAYVGSSDKKLYAFDVGGTCVHDGNCSRRWTATTGGEIRLTTPAVGEGTVFVKSRDRKLYAFSADGTTNCSGTPTTCTPLWTAATGAAVDNSPVVSLGVVYLVGGNSKLQAYDARGLTNCSGTPVTCKPLWTAAISQLASPSPTVADGTVFVVGTDGVLAAFDAHGATNCSGTPVTCKPLWTTSPGSIGIASPAVADGRVYLPGPATGVVAFDASGATNCSGTPKICTRVWAGTSGGSGTEVAVANGRVYAANSGTVSVFDAAGIDNCTAGTCSPLWTARVKGSGYPPTVANGIVYVPSGSYISAFDAAGETGCSGVPRTCTALWVTDDGGSRYGVAVADGTVYAPAATSNTILAYQPCVNPVAFAGHSPCEIRNAYRLPSIHGGEGMTVGIVDAYHAPTAASDLAHYRNTFKMIGCSSSTGCFRQVNQRGESSNYPPVDTGWALEVALDVQMVSAVCPNCKILLVEADSPSVADMTAAVDTAVALGADVVSNSYGTDEDPGLLPFDAHYDHAGVPMVAASGDDGYAAGPQWPAVIPSVTSAGGTILHRTPGSGRGWSDYVWNRAGSGCSTVEPKPAWQTDAGCSMRTNNDVAAVGDRLAVYDTFGFTGWLSVGGTSASAPIIAAIYALAHGTEGVSSLYAGTEGLFDVTEGTNGTCSPAYLCSAGVGYDAPTGVGVPCGVGAFGPAIPSPDACRWPASESVSSRSLGAAVGPARAPDAVPACRQAPPGHVRCLAYVQSLPLVNP